MTFFETNEFPQPDRNRWDKTAVWLQSTKFEGSLAQDQCHLIFHILFEDSNIVLCIFQYMHVCIQMFTSFMMYVCRHLSIEIFYWMWVNYNNRS